MVQDVEILCGRIHSLVVPVAQSVQRLNYWAGRSGDRIPVGGEIFRTSPDRPWGPPSLLYNGYRVFLRVESGRGVTLTHHPLLVPRSRKRVQLYLYYP
jgi:hypothetical protein